MRSAALTLPDDLRIAAHERRLIPFIGSGFSLNINEKFPTWEGIIKEMAAILDYDAPILRLHGDNLQIAEYLSHTGNLGKLKKKASHLLDNENYNVSDSKPHCLLPELDVSSIYTTNWDNWIEEGFRQTNMPFDKIFSANHFAKPISQGVDSTSPHRKHRRTTIYKFHGDFEETDSIVINESSYFNRLDFNHPLDVRLRSDILGKSVVFMGYSFSDPNIRYIWHRLFASTPEMDERPISYFVTHEENPILKKNLEKRKVEYCVLDPANRKASLTEFLQLLIKAQK